MTPAEADMIRRAFAHFQVRLGVLTDDGAKRTQQGWLKEVLLTAAQHEMGRPLKKCS
jgi:hypothetical protein